MVEETENDEMQDKENAIPHPPRKKRTRKKSTTLSGDIDDTKPITIDEFKTWLEGAEAFQGDDWTPGKAQWKIIRNKIKNLTNSKEIELDSPYSYVPQSHSVEQTFQHRPIPMPTPPQPLGPPSIGTPQLETTLDNLEQKKYSPQNQQGGSYESSFT